MIAESGLQGLPGYFGDYPSKLLFSLRRFPKGRHVKDLAGDVGALPKDIREVEAALVDLEDLGLVEKVETRNEADEITDTIWRIAR